MSDDYGVDLDEIFEIISSCEVLIVRFHIFRKRLLVDFRSRPGQPPIMRVVPPAESIEERFRSIKEMRPDFGMPEKVMSFYWPRSIKVLADSGTWERIASRFAAIGGEDSKMEAEQAWNELSGTERLEVSAAIRGSEHYQTLWERQEA